MPALPPSLKARSTLQEQEERFSSDPRISFSRETKTWRLENEDGTELEFDVLNGAWVTVVDDAVFQAQQAAYSIAGVDESAPAAPVLARENKKRKKQEEANGYTDPGPSKRGKTDGDANGQRKSKNTAVYVSRLPLDTTEKELYDAFSRYGVIEEDEGGEHKIKMYAKDDGSFSGDALVVYFKEDSVDLAVRLQDEAELRLGEPETVMSVKRAEFGHKQSTTEGGEPKPRKVVDKKKATKRIGKMQSRIDEWGFEDEGFGPTLEPQDTVNAINKNSRVVVLKHMFTLEELEEEPALLLDLKEDVRDECSSLGQVTNVVLYDKEPEGIMTVKFKEPLGAQACVLRMNGRYFAGRTIEASLFAGKQRFKRSGAGDEYEGDGDEAEKRRMDDFANWLMTEGD